MLSKRRFVSTGWPKTKTKSIYFIASSFRNVLASGVLLPSAVRLLCLKGRKLIGFDRETQRALELLSRDSEKSLRELADEAFADLWAKYCPRTLVEALKQISRLLPANENKPKERRRS
jgi:hypothetical protein